MTFFNRIFRLCWIGVCALTMLAQTRLVLAMPLVPTWLDGYVFCSTVFAYGFTHPDRRLSAPAWLAGATGGFCYVLPFLQSGAVVAWQWVAWIPLLLWLGYYGLQRPGTSGLRGVPVAKPLVVSLTWAIVTVFMPLPPERWAEALFVFAGRAFFIFGLALAYDLSDIVYDKQYGLPTLAGRLGARSTFRLIDLAFGISVVCYAVNAWRGVFAPGTALALAISLLLSAGWLRYLLRETPGESRQKILIDALMPVQFLLVLIMAGIHFLLTLLAN